MIKNAFVVGLLAVWCVPTHHSTPIRTTRPVQQDIDRINSIANRVSHRHNIPLSRAKRIITIATKYEHHTFPRAEDIVAIIGVESNFKANAKSKLVRDPAVGLMQVRLRVWRDVVGSRDMSDESQQIAIGSHILREYYIKLGHVHGAVTAYNVGITNYRRGRLNNSYLGKYMRERTHVTTNSLIAV